MARCANARSACNIQGIQENKTRPQPVTEPSPPDRITAMRRVFAAEAQRSREEGSAPSASLYMQTQTAILLCDLLEATTRQAEATELLCDELREMRLSRPR